MPAQDAASRCTRKGKGPANIVTKSVVWKKDTMVLRTMTANKVPTCEELMAMGAIHKKLYLILMVMVFM